MAYSKNRRLADIIADTDGNITVPTQSASDNDTSAASTAYVTTAVNNLIDSAPGTMNTLNEIAAAINDDADFNTTVNTAINLKAPLASPSLTGTVTITGASSAYNTLQLTSNSTGHGTIINLGDTSDANYGSITQFATSAGEGGRMRFIAGTTETMNLKGGNVGIGTSSPSRLLDIENSTSGGSTLVSLVSATDGNVQLLMGDTASDTQGKVFYDNVADEMSLHANGAERVRIDSSGNVGIGTDDPKAKLHVQGTSGLDGQAFGDKTLSLTTSFQTNAQLAITLADHQGCFVRVFVTGDWSGHSAMAFLGEYFIQNGASGYAEPGVIIREIDNTSSVDSLSSQIVDSTNDTFQIQFKLNQSHNANTADGKLYYHIMGQFDTIA